MRSPVRPLPASPWTREVDRERLYCPGDPDAEEPEAHLAPRLVREGTPPWRCLDHAATTRAPDAVPPAPAEDDAGRPWPTCLWCGGRVVPGDGVTLRRLPAGLPIAVAHRVLGDCEPPL